MRQVPTNIGKFRLIFPFFLVIILDVMSFGIVQPVLSVAVVDNTQHIFGLHSTVASRHAIYGFLLAIATLCYMFGTPILGYFSDRVGRRKILLVCLIGSLLGLLGYVLSFTLSSLPLLIIARIIIGFTSGSVAVAQSAIADVTSGVEKAKNIGVIAVALTIGLVAGPLVGGVLSDPTVLPWFNTNTPFYAGIILSIISLIVLLYSMQETHEIVQNKNKNSLIAEVKLLGHEFMNITCRSNIHFILLTFFLFELGWSLYFQSLALLLAQSLNASLKMIGLLSSFVGLVLSLGLIYGVRFVVKRYKLTSIIGPSLVFGCLALIIGFIFNGLVLQWLIAIPIAIVVAFCYSILITFASDKTDANKQGLLMGTTDSLLALAFTITGYLSGVLAIHNAVLPQLVAAIFFAFGFLLYPLAKKQYLKE